LLFPGADDNASGTAVLLETARVLAQSGSRPRRSIVFLSFSGEEQGLLGSRTYVDKPAHPLNATAGMINVDHAGAGNGRLTIGVTGIPNTTAAQAAEHAGLADRIDLFGFFPGGDHVPFKEAGVPTVTVVSGGVHPNFHQPSDTADHVRPDILETTARYVAALAWRWANEP
jgi:Zn-dependent M28 family amino/carboxypeptidase